MRDLEDEERIKAYMKAKMAHIKMYHECMNLADGLDVEKFAELVRADEREACAKLVEADGLARGDEGLVLIKAAGRIRTRSEKPPVKTYCGGKPNYCTPEVTPDVAAINISQEPVDETAKRKHEPVAYVTIEPALDGGWLKCHSIKWFNKPTEGPLYAAPPKREWVGLTSDDVHDAFNYVEMVKLLDFDRDRPDWCEAFASACEATLRHKNGGNK